MVAVADPVVGSPLTHGNARVLPCSLQLRHPLPGEESCPRGEETNLEGSSLTRQAALAPPPPPPPRPATGVDPGRLAGVRAGPVRGGETAGSLLAHVNFPLVERSVMDHLEDRLVAGGGGQLQQDHVVRVAVLEHPIPPHPPLADLPHLLRGVLPGWEGREGEGAEGGVQVELVQHQGDSVAVQRLEARQAAQRSSGVVKPEVSGVENSHLNLRGIRYSEVTLGSHCDSTSCSASSSLSKRNMREPGQK